jgi:Ca2+-binding EF-hand superfamily protein
MSYAKRQHSIARDWRSNGDVFEPRVMVSPKSHLELSELFREFDSNGDGRIDVTQYACLVSSLHVAMSHPQILDAFRQIDGDDKRTIDFVTFLRWRRAREAA